jgi:hypothetical protein
VKVMVTEVRSQVDPMALAMHEQAREAGIDMENPIKGSRQYSAVVEYEGKRERWPLSVDSAFKVLMEFAEQRDQRATEDVTPEGKPPATLEPLAIELPQPDHLLPV